MRGKYTSRDRRVFTSSGYKVGIGIVAVIAAALIVLLLVLLPAVDDKIEADRQIVSIENTSGEIGVGSDLSKIFVTVTYSDGTTETVSMASLTHEGLDVSVAGEQNISLSYGGFEQTIPIVVRDVDCLLQYQASVGGRIQGEQAQSVINGGDAATVIAIPETGYVFVKWNDGFPYATRKDIGVTENKVYIAIFEKAQYTVRFYYDDGTVASEEKVTYGEAPTKIPNATSDPKMQKYGYTFTNWVPMDFSVIDRDIIIRPEYVKTATDVNVTVPADKYGANMGTTDVRSEGYYAHDVYATVTATPFNSREFAYWLVETSDGSWSKVLREDNKTYSIGTNNYNVNFRSTTSGSSASDYVLSFLPTSDVIQLNIRAVFAYSESNISFINYQNPANNNVELYITGLRFGRPLSTYETAEISFADGMPQPDAIVGMQFLGWFEEEDITQTVVTTDITFEQPARLIAKWKRLQYDIVFRYTDEDNNIIEWHRTKVIYQDTFAGGSNGGLPLTNPTLDHYIFSGWKDALSGDTVDDKTKLYAQEEYLDNDSFLTAKTLYMVPIWTPVSHTLNVRVNGSGAVKMIIDSGKFNSEGADISETVEDIKGSYSILETHTYMLIFEALRGFEVRNLVWSYADSTKTDDFAVDALDNIKISLDADYDNNIAVDFDVIKYDVTVTNGDYGYSGLINVAGLLYNDSQFVLSVDYNATLELYIESQNDKYSIDDIIVSGKSGGKVLANQSYKPYLEDSSLSYTLVLDRCLSDISIDINYLVRKYAVNNGAVSGGEILITDFYNTGAGTAVAEQTEYDFGDTVYYKISAAKTSDVYKYLDTFRLNGIKLDLYTPSQNNVIFYGWEINGVSLGIGLIRAGEKYYYNYGIKEYEGESYAYCEATDGNEVTLFHAEAVGGDYDYTALSGDETGYAALMTFLKNELSIESRSVYNTSVDKDRRITRVYLMLTVKENANISMSFTDMVYNVSVANDVKAESRVTVAEPSYKGSSTVTVYPSTGYYVVGYYLNGGDLTEVTTAEKGVAYSVTFTNIIEDKALFFEYAPITFSLLFNNASPLQAELFVGSNKMSNAYEIDMEYHSAAEYTVTVNTAGKRISKITINDVEQMVHFNMTSYTIIVNNMTEAIVVDIWCADKTAESVAGANQYTIVYEEENIFGTSVSPKYTTCAAGEENVLRVLAYEGYKISTVTVSGKNALNEAVAVPFDAALAGSTSLDIVIPANTFFDCEVSVSVSTSKDRYVMTKSAIGNGSIGDGGYIYHSETVEIYVTANPNNYISSFKINGEEISFGATNWSELNYNSTLKQYSYGVYSFIASGDVNVEVTFAINSYAVSLDPNSTNGKTTLSVVSRGTVDSVFYGEYLNITMEADIGFHISAIYINSTLVTDYVLKSKTINANTTDAYVYKGKLLGTNYSGITEKTIVRVVYEINHYNFSFVLDNGSKNFAGETGAGILTSEYSLEDSIYSGIEHGSNFSFDITPALSNGYYLYSVYIKYKSAYSGESEEVTRYHYDSEGIVSTRGGTIWFNRFMGFDEGLTANVELIKAVFKRNFYTITLSQPSAKETGTILVEYVNRSNILAPIILSDNEGNFYYYRNDGNIYYLSGDSYVLSDITFEYDEDTAQYVYMNDGSIIDLQVEHGINYSVRLLPSEGYARTAFTVNGENMLSLIIDNKYGVNLTRSVTLSVEYTILTYTVSFSTTVINKNLTGKLSNSLIKNYMDISIKDLDTDTVYNLAVGSAQIIFTTRYGARLQFISNANFDTTGYYLYSLIANEEQIDNYYGSVYDEAIYGGNDYSAGYKVQSDISVKATYRIMRYSVNTDILYTENILNESVNNVREESGSSIAWGDSAYIRIVIGDGYELDDITVFRGAISSFVILNPSSEIINNLTEQMRYNEINQNTNERRNVLVITAVKSDIMVEVTYVRKDFVLRYKINGVDNLDKINTTFNAYNATYPTLSEETDILNGTWESANVNILNTKYYDEIAAVIMPKNGYMITETIVTIKAVYYNTQTSTWDAILGDDGKEKVYTLNFVETFDDSRAFTFHNPNTPIAALNVKSDLEMTFTIKVKSYSVSTSVTRFNGTNNTNNSEIELSITDKNGNYIIKEDGNNQYGQKYVLDGVSPILIAEHHGNLLYSFSLANGYMLNKFSLNGLEWIDFKTTTLTNIYFNYSAHSEIDGYGNIFYIYTIRVPINDSLIAGSDNFVKGMYDINCALEIAPIVYTVKTIINGTEYDFEMLSGKSGVTDGTTLSIYSPQSVTHFATLSIEPAALTGYRVTGLSISVGSETTANNTAGFNIGDYTVKKVFSINSSNLPGSNVLNNCLTIYLYYTSAIKTYQVNIGAYAYSSDHSLVGNESIESEINLNSSAGIVTVTPSRTDGSVLTYSGVSLFEYFMIINVRAVAKAGYTVYSIEEKLQTGTDGDGNPIYAWSEINDGVRGIRYTHSDVGGEENYYFVYEVDDYGNRQFRVVYKQKTTVTVNVINPYKYVSGTIAIGDMDYYYYATVTAKENNAVLESSYDYGSNIVKDKYVFDVYVGNYISLGYTDSYQKTGQVGYSFKTYNDSTMTYTVNNSIATESGSLIDGSMELYLFTEVFSRVTFKKDTFSGDVNAEGGTIVFNGAGTESTNMSIYSSATVTDKKLSITVRPNANYIYTGLKVHQIDVEKSKKQGKIVYKTGMNEWLVYDENTFDTQDSNGFIISSSYDSRTGYTTYDVIMRGDMELAFEFYRIYEIEYASFYSDSISRTEDGSVVYYNPSKHSGSDIIYEDEIDNVTTNSGDKYYLSYDAGFTLTAPSAPEKYVFVGWYVNGVNTYKYLDVVLPGDDYATNSFIINADNMDGLFINGAEVSKLSFLAMYQPILTVGLINELYYYNNTTAHWNSWASGYASAEGYNYNGDVIPEASTANAAINNTYKTINDTNNTTFSQLNTLAGGNVWSAVMKDVSAYSIPTTNNLYSAVTLFDVLYQNVSDGDFISNSWVNGSLGLNISNLSTTVHFTSWQYYNWNTNTYEDITYSYADSNYGLDSEGNAINVTCYYENYRLALESLYNGEMPYATSSTSIKNADNTYPLLIRINLWKSVAVNLEKATYTDILGGAITNNVASMISPTINRSSITNSSELHTSTSDDGMMGEYDYGANLYIMYYTNTDKYGKVLDYTSGGIRYRFLGWALNWEVNKQTEYRIISDDDNMSGYAVNLTYKFGEAPPNESMEFRAIYVTQYKQSVFSYNIAGGDTYAMANSGGTFAVKDAPAINVSIVTKSAQFNCYNMTTGEVTQKPYYENLKEILMESHVKEFYVDRGANYNISVDMTKVGEATSMNASNCFGFDPQFDKQYAIKENGDINLGGSTYNGEEKTVTMVNSLELQYYTEAVLKFTDVMYKSGIKVPLSIAKALIGVSQDMTVWDEDGSNFGDGNITADGIVTMHIKLTEGGVNYHGSFDYSPLGYKSGNGIPAVKQLTYYYTNATGSSINCDQHLFNPANESYRRNVVINYNDGYLTNGSLLFGNATVALENRYKVSNTGDGSDDAPYKIYTVGQLQNMSLFFTYNEHSCVNDAGNKTNFKLFQSLVLQTGRTTASVGTTAPYGLSTNKAWVPLCYYYETATREHFGFDGIFDGNNFVLEGIAADGNANLTPIDNEINPLANFDYVNLQGYGLFGCINGGTIKNLKLGNAYMNMNSFATAGVSGNVSYVGVLTARAYAATFENIVFAENSTAGRFSGASFGVASTYISARNSVGVGLLAGYAEDCTINDIALNVTKGADIGVEILGGSTSTSAVGGLIGVATTNNVNSGSILENIKVLVTSGSMLLLNYENGISCPNTGGIIGLANGNGSMEINKLNLHTTGDSNNRTKAYFGSTTAVNVGGLVGTLSGQNITMSESTVISCGVTGTVNNLQAEYEVAVSTKGYGLFLTASSLADIGGEAMATGGDSAYGKAGTVVGFVKSATVRNSVDVGIEGGAFSLSGGVYLHAGTAGGVIGVNNGGFIEGFRLYSVLDDSGISPLKLHCRMTMSAQNNFGGIAGANLNYGVINNCNYESKKTIESGTNSDLRYSYMYVFRKDGANDTAYRSLEAVNSISEYRKTITANKLQVGGIVGYNTSGVFNTFVKKSRIYIDYNNGASENRCDWAIQAGGIVGYHNALSIGVEGSYYGYDEIRFIGYDGIKQANGSFYNMLCRVQSCYTANMGIVVMGHIWVDNNANFAKSGKLLTERGGVGIGGIAGGVNTTGTIGKYAINNCYSMSDVFYLGVSGWGLTSNSETEGDSSVGWYHDKGTLNIGEKIRVNRVGFQVDGGIYGICGGYDLELGGSVATFCWSNGNRVTKENGGYGTNASDFEKEYGVFDNPSSGDYKNYRGVDFIYNEASTANGCAAWGPGWMYGDSGLDQIVCMPVIQNTVVGSTTITPATAQPLYCAGFVGYAGDWDGRVYKTDPHTGILTRWHDAADNVTCYWGFTSVDVNGENAYNFYAVGLSDYMNYVKDTSSISLVRGQSTSALRNGAYTIPND